ncbi:ABC transporter substrate-binding protein [Labrenzia sp. PHM005]|uniref:substrate-binding periplasmic protein n=1 Tax=Labrenzia sp. PHM005 TaxID=2590016 RepID=UPI00143CEE86|nr:transporter substrate-binding domain-containing protein [Labrenzia sp. PHM005]
MRSLAFLLFFLVLPYSARAAELTIALEDAEYFPWQLESGIGADTYLIETAARNLGHRLIFKRVPWTRCLNQIGNNKFDGCYSASFEPERMKHGVFPMAGDRPDPAKRLHSESYSLYVQDQSSVNWTGAGFENLNGDIGAIFGYSIIEHLKNNNANVYEAHSLERLFKMLDAGRLDAVASLTLQADYIIQRTPGYGERILKAEIPLAEKHYYLMFSHKMANTHPALVADFYEEIERIRQSAGYRDHYSNLVR